MQRSRKLVSALVLAALLLTSIAPVALAQFTPLIYAIDQDVVDGVVNVTRVTSDGPGWVVIHADDNGAPGPVLGYAAVPAGISANVKVEIDTADLAEGAVLHPMLHVDAGVEGTYEFPGDDAPAEVDGEIVMVMITATAVGQSLASVAADAGFDTLLAAVEAAGLTSELATGGPYTVFAPTNDAFAALPAEDLDALLADPEALSNVLLYHVVPGVVPSSAITESMMVASVQGAELDVQVSDAGITVNGAAVTAADVEAYNGVIHVIDAVLLPPAPEEEASAEEAAPEAAATEAVTATETVTMTPAMTETFEPASTMVDLVDAAQEAGSFTTLLAALEAAGLTDALRGEGPFTVFAPTDDAFAALPEGTLDSLLADPSGDLTQILLYHVVSGQVAGADVTDGLTAETLQGRTVSFTVADGAIMINDANIVATDVAASNGVIHVIDAVLLPSAAGEAAEESSAEAAPAETATETAAAPAELPTTGAARQETLDIVDTAAGAGNFSTLVAAVQAAGLVDALKGEGPFTVFAPTDEAFAKIPQETLDALLADPTGNLTQILLYHVVPGKVLAADVVDGLTAQTLQGGTVTFTVAEGAVKINDANIVATDLLASNGVIHVIDSVILPTPEEPAAEEAAVVEAAPAGTVPAPVEEAPAESAPGGTVPAPMEAAPVEPAADTSDATDAAATDAAAEAPATLPTTGAPASNGALTLGVTTLVLLALVAVAYATRRRTA